MEIKTVSETNLDGQVEELQDQLADMHRTCLTLEASIPQYQAWIDRDRADLVKAEAERKALSQRIVAMGHTPLKPFTREDLQAQRQECILQMLAEMRPESGPSLDTSLYQTDDPLDEW